MSIERLLSAPDGPVDILKVLEPEAYAHVQELIDGELLPSDTFLRLNGIAYKNTELPAVDSANLRWKMLMELDTFSGIPDQLSALTRNTIFGEAARALLTWNPTLEAETLHTRYDQPFFTRLDLAEVVRERRVDEGKTVTEVPVDKRWRPPVDIERGQCLRIAHGLWSVLARRIMPEWLEPSALEYFYMPHKSGSYLDLGSEKYIMSRRIVGAIALKVAHIKEVYDESLSLGVRGIGPVGKRDIRMLIADEYPELY